ncbi:glutathione S-transferase family protein [Massilia sp. TS11]|uniref:glutathione S-transferase family protein n=1 Tax=Massilia sp. TS11 TaxID=2908003 RepID=UPI001EDA5C26|nr:glutathione S-transferase family protein [Massilia sp. TS11]MCG2583642.1 glutathione S-transferase family protein [Massilia sp. TS11]
MKLYYHPGSANARRVRLAAHALGLPLELEFVDLMDADARRRLLELNPNNKVPVLADDGFLLTESHAIMLYLCERAPVQSLLPAGLQARADVTRWLFWSAQHWQPAVSILTWENLWKQRTGRGPADLNELARGAAQFSQFAQVLEQQLTRQTWVCGDSLGLADYALAAALNVWREARIPLEDYPHILAWFGRVEASPAWQATV